MRNSNCPLRHQPVGLRVKTNEIGIQGNQHCGTTHISRNMFFHGRICHLHGTDVTFAVWIGKLDSRSPTKRSHLSHLWKLEQSARSWLCTLVMSKQCGSMSARWQVPVYLIPKVFTCHQIGCTILTVRSPALELLMSLWWDLARNMLVRLW